MRVQDNSKTPNATLQILIQVLLIILLKFEAVII